MLILDYEQFKSSIIERGADPKVFEMPAIKERLYGKDIEDVFVNADGTIDFDGYHMKKCQNESEDYFTLEKITQKKDDSYYIMDDPIRSDNSDSYIITANKILIDENGIETELQTKVSVESSPKKYEGVKFDEFPGIAKKTVRKDGMIIEEGKNRNVEFFDDGYWAISSGDGKNTRCSIGTKDENKVSRAIHIFEHNESEILRKYPNLDEDYKRRKEALYKNIDDRIEHLEYLQFQNERLQRMLGKSLDFAEQVRSSIVGKMFFGKKANEVLGERRDVIGELSEKNDDEQEIN